MSDNNTLSSLELLLLGNHPEQCQAEEPPLHKGDLCPMCGEGIMDYDGLLQLRCAVCGYVSGDTGGCT